MSRAILPLLFFTIFHLTFCQEISTWSKLNQEFASMAGDHKEIISLFEANKENLEEPGPGNSDYLSCLSQIYTAYLYTGNRKQAKAYVAKLAAYQNQGNVAYTLPGNQVKQETDELKQVKNRLSISRSEENDAQMEVGMKNQAAMLQAMASSPDLDDADRAKLAQLSSIMANYSADGDMGTQLQQMMNAMGVSEADQAEMLKNIGQAQSKFSGSNTISEGSSLHEQFHEFHEFHAESKANADRQMNLQDQRINAPVNMQQNFLSINNYLKASDWMTDQHIKALNQIPKNNYDRDLSLEQALDLFQKEYKMPISNTEKAGLENSLNEMKKLFDRELEKTLEGNRELLQSFAADVPMEVSYGPVLRTVNDINERREEAKAFVEIILEVYDNVAKLIGINNLSEMAFESEQVRQISTNRQANLNVILQLHNRFSAPNESMTYNMFDRQKEGFEKYDFNSMISSKEIDYKTQQFLREGYRRSNDPELKALYNMSRNRRNKMGIIHQMSLEDQTALGWTPAAYEDSIEQVRKWEKEIYFKITQTQSFEDYAANLTTTWQAIQSRLSDDEVFVDIERIEDINNPRNVSYLISVIRRKGKPEAITLGGTNGLAFENRYKLINHSRIGSDPGSNLEYEDFQPYEQFWTPIAEKISDASRVYLSTDGIYSQLSLGAMRNPQTKEYLIDEVDLVRLSSISSFKANKTYSQTKDVYLFGNPAYDIKKKSSSSVSDSRRALFSGSPLPSLPGTLAEVNTIQGMLQEENWTPHTYIDDEATESAFKQITDPSILHVATHGYFDAPGGKGQSLNSVSRKFIENPFLRSRLYFAGANQTLAGTAISGEDEVLTAEEIFYQNLKNTNLVVLSACETGLGEKIDGEGVFGLSRAFHLAGANEVIMSLWTVSDEATKDLMISFYNYYIKEKLNTNEALKKAKLETREKYTHPYFWAAFVLSE